MSTRYNSKHCLYYKAGLSKLKQFFNLRFCSAQCKHADHELLQKQGFDRLRLESRKAALKAEWDSHGLESWIDPGYAG